MVRFAKAVVTASLTLFGVLIATPADAGALLRLTPGGFSSAGYEEAGFPVDPVIITSDTFRLTFHSEGNTDSDLVNPVLLILGVPDTTVAPAITVGSDINGFTDVSVSLIGPVYGGSWAPDGSGGVFDGTGDTKVYDFLDLAGGNASQNYSNWTGATGLTSWNLFVYGITFDPEMSRGSYAEFVANLPNGTYIVGYGCESLDDLNTCDGNGETQSTPFTFAGLVNVPEPATLTLLIPGVAALLARRRKTQVS